MKTLAIGAATGLGAIALLLPWTLGTLATLADARAEQARLAAATVAPPAPAIVSPGQAILAGTRAAATGVLAARVRAAAAKGGVLVEGLDPVATAGGLAGLRMRLSGSEGAVLGLADALERGTPVVRFARWRVEAAPGCAVRLTAEMVAPWG